MGKISVGALQRMESALVVTGVYMCQNKYPVFYRKIPFLGSPPPHMFCKYSVSWNTVENNSSGHQVEKGDADHAVTEQNHHVPSAKCF